MSVYMGNRSVLQIKSHMQKHLSDVASGKVASGSTSPSSAPHWKCESSPGPSACVSQDQNDLNVPDTEPLKS
eukprot:2553286-Rhodomonas_salina.1